MTWSTLHNIFIYAWWLPTALYYPLLPLYCPMLSLYCSLLPSTAPVARLTKLLAAEAQAGGVLVEVLVEVDAQATQLLLNDLDLLQEEEGRGGAQGPIMN